MANQNETDTVPCFSTPTSERHQTPETQPSLSPSRTIRSLPQRRNKRPRLNHITPPPPPPPAESCSPTDASRGGSPVTPPTRPFPFHSPRTKEAIATLTESVAALNIHRPSRTPMNSEDTQFESDLDTADTNQLYPFRIPQLHPDPELEGEDYNEEDDPVGRDVEEEEDDDGKVGPEDEDDDEDEEDDDQVDEADQDFSAYTFLSTASANRAVSSSHPGLSEHLNANRKKRKVPSPAALTLVPPTLPYTQDYEPKSDKTFSGYQVSQNPGHAGPAFGQLLRAAQLGDEVREYDDADEEDDDVPRASPPVDFRDPAALAKALSSHHVKMQKKPISSPRHYGRHLHKLALSRLLSRPPPSPSIAPKPAVSSVPVPSNQTSTPVKKNKAAIPTPRSSPAPRRTPKRKTPLRHKVAVPVVSKLKLPVLPNLYDPSLPIDVSYPTALNHAQLIKSRSSYYGGEARIEEDHCSGFEVFSSRSSSLDHNRDVSISSLNHLNENEDEIDRSALRGEFSFRLEIRAINERLAALHLAIADEKKSREDQMREAMKIAMDQQQDLRHHLRRSGKNSASADSKAGHLEQRIPSNGKQLGEATGSRTQKSMSSIKSMDRHALSNGQSRPQVPERPSGNSRIDHGPSGPPPSEPPPPLPINPRSTSTSKRTNNTSSNQIPEPVPTPHKKNGKKGKKKRSAHANANNIHHRDNYIPSRLPTTHQQTTTAGQGVLGTDLATIDLLAQDYDPAGSRSTLHPFIDPNLSIIREGENEKILSTGHNQLGTSAISKFFVEPDEWICGFCEYELWFGEELSLIKVIKNRKMILRRRKRAKDRAARAAAGIKNSNNTGGNTTTAVGNGNGQSSIVGGPSTSSSVKPPPPPPPPSSSVSP
ncbi:hypothetical protein CROQUDRAFT_95097 [Cronartium quercuum f. sp. fusiforme G11]|uniref:Uncharacterized protein n=1 Tax=Cronartium quercuum f. sp. fusiforme G11 TaxID=708437 RepID=A0A9P6TB95_9BASI|nr:hypothetical protein CROQUDRAFT_95097 [Cronartium quercuum f. sp. fusiforme G11]